MTYCKRSHYKVFFKNKKPTKWFGLAKRHATKIRPKAIGGNISDCFLELDKCRPEVAGDVVSDAAVHLVSMDNHVKCCDSMLNSGQIIWLAGPLLRTFVRDLIAFLQLTGSS